MLDSQKGKIARWTSLLSEYESNVDYKKGKELQHVDFLSRYLYAELEFLLDDRMWYFTTTDHPIPSIESILVAQKQTPPPSATKGFAMKNDVIYYLICVTPCLRPEVTASCHSIAPFHHPGIKKTKKTIMRTFN